MGKTYLPEANESETTMTMRTIIDWRPYPEQKPPHSQRIYVCLESGINVARHKWLKGEWVAGDGPNITHFALPSDISTVEVEG